MMRASPVREEIQRAETVLIRRTRNRESRSWPLREFQIRTDLAQLTLRLLSRSRVFCFRVGLARQMAQVLQPWQLFVSILAGWINERQQSAIEYLREESRVLKEQLASRLSPMSWSAE